MTRLSTEDFEAKFHSFRYSVFRLETLQTYRGSGEDDALAAFRAGHRRPPPDRAQDDWEAMIRANRRAGKLMQRVHVVVEPPSDYLRFELTWAYAPNVAAGEDVRIIPVTSSWPNDVPRADFWLFDSSELFDAHYTDDGTWRGVAQVHDPARVVAACRYRDAAMHHGQPWNDFVRERPALLKRIPTV